MHGFELVEDGFDDVFLAGEQFVGAGVVEAGEGGFVEGFGWDDAAGGELVDDEFDEADLVGGEAAVVEEFGEGLLGGGAVHADQAADEPGE